jgi:hypothetical protein
MESASFGEVFYFFARSYKKLFFSPSVELSVFFLCASFGVLIYYLLKQKKTKRTDIALVIVTLHLAVLFSGFVLNRVPSEAYLPMFFPGLIIVLSFSLTKIFSQKFASFLGALVVSLIFVNVLSIMETEFFTKNSITMNERKDAAQLIIDKANGRKYNLEGDGPGSEFASFTANYEYLTWWLGNPPSKDRQILKFIIIENKPFPEVKMEDVIRQ